MPIRHRKGPGVIAECRIPSRCKPHYLSVYLWESCEAMNVGARADGDALQGLPTDRIERTGENTGLCCLASYTEHVEKSGAVTARGVRPRLAEIHLVRGRWGEEVVAHELCHALMHRMRVLDPGFEAVRDQDGDSEETVCYEFGEWFQALWSWLWEVDAYGKHAASGTAASASDGGGGAD